MPSDSVDAVAAIARCAFNGNAGTWGGGFDNLGTLTVSAATAFMGNTATDGGGGYSQGSLTMSGGCSFVTNTATNAGGGLFQLTTGTLSLGDTTFSGNVAPNGPNEFDYTP